MAAAKKPIVVLVPDGDWALVTRAVSEYLRSSSPDSIPALRFVKANAKHTKEVTASVGASTSLSGDVVLARYLCRKYGKQGSLLLNECAFGASLVDQWLRVTAKDVAQNQGAFLRAMVAYDDYLQMRTFMVGNQLSLADINMWAMIECNRTFFQKNAKHFPHVNRAFGFLSGEPALKTVATDIRNQMKAVVKANAKGAKAKRGDAFLELKNNPQMGKVKTRFPPEPSGYLHIGHAKALLLNSHYANHYKGAMQVRFDDTNPNKEKVEFTEAILQDLDMIGCLPKDKKLVSHTSDHFDRILNHCENLIKEGKAFVDSQAQEVIQEQRYNKIPSPFRDQDVKENLRLWNLMKKGEPEGVKCVVRAKIDPTSSNGSLRDPNIFRCIVDVPHQRTGSKYKVYPLYDFACPIVDSTEGVTHALRSKEYHDHNPLYEWVLKVLKLKFVQIEDFSRINFRYTLMSKRKLQWFVDEKIVDGWDSPAFPTLRGMVRRGLVPDALRAFMIAQGSSKSDVMMEILHLWAKNRAHIDPITPRYMAVEKENAVRVTLSNAPAEPSSKSVPRHPKNKELGECALMLAGVVLIDFEDAGAIQENQLFALLNYSSVMPKKIVKNEKGQVVEIVGDLVETPIKDAKLKVHWVPEIKDAIKIEFREYDTLITKEKIEPNDEFQAYVNKKIEYISEYVGQPCMKDLRTGDQLQLLRRGYCKVDRGYDFKNPNQPIILLDTPDGKRKQTFSTALSRSIALREQSKNKSNTKAAK